MAITEKQIAEIVARTQNEFKDYFEGVNDPHFRKFIHYINTGGSLFDGKRFIVERTVFNELPDEIKQFFYSEIKICELKSL